MRAEPIVNGLEKEWAGAVRVMQINVQDRGNRALTDRLEAQFTPTFILFDAGGEEVWRAVGNISPDEVRSQVNALDQ